MFVLMSMNVENVFGPHIYSINESTHYGRQCQVTFHKDFEEIILLCANMKHMVDWVNAIFLN